jgi:hypothetical protein
MSSTKGVISSIVALLRIDELARRDFAHRAVRRTPSLCMFFNPKNTDRQPDRQRERAGAKESILREESRLVEESRQVKMSFPSKVQIVIITCL